MITANDIVARHEENARARTFLSVAVAKHLARDQGLEGLCAAFEARSGKQFVPIFKAAVTAIDSSSALYQLAPLAQAFVAAADRESILGALPGLRVPLGTQGKIQILNVEARSSAEGTAKLFGAMAFESADDPPEKIVAMIAITDEVARSLDPVAQEGLRRALVSALAARVDAYLVEQFTSGAAIAETGADLETVAALLAALSGGKPARPAIIGTYQTLGPIDLRNYRDLGVTFLTTPAAGDNLIAVDGAALLIQDGGAELDVGRHGNVVLDDGEPLASETVINLWQSNLIALRAERFVRVDAPPSAVAYAVISA